ncbi:MAG TPA: hypothetical protein DHV37_05875 [Erysipelotrichaceae bacterium]|nr:hypothetical protein [Erysipelotrichaceae bacterium]
MKRSYERTLLVKDLAKAEVEITVFDRCKYEMPEVKEVLKYRGVTSWDVIEGGEEADSIENDGLVDEHHEYLVLHFNDGSQATFRNSHVDMFIY